MVRYAIVAMAGVCLVSAILFTLSVRSLQGWRKTADEALA